MDHSAKIVVGVGTTKGLAWEIEQIREKRLLAKTVFIFPPAYARDRNVLAGLLHQLGLDAIPELEGRLAVLSLFLRRPGEAVLLTTAERLTEMAYRLALRAPAVDPSIFAPTARGGDPWQPKAPDLPPDRAHLSMPI